MAPPRITSGPGANQPENPNLDQPTAHELHLKLHRYFELGTVYTMVAGLLNVLAIYDAWGGPVWTEPTKKEDEPEQAKDETKTDKDG